MISINLNDTQNRRLKEQVGPYFIYEYAQDLSVHPENAIQSYFAAQMNVRKRQVFVQLNNSDVIVQAGAMQWNAGDVNASTNIKGAGDFIKKLASSKVTHEGTVNMKTVARSTFSSAVAGNESCCS